MRVRKAINIKGEKYSFKYLTPQEMGHVYGRCDFANKIIYYDGTLKGDILIQTILHEIGHAILFEVGLLQAVNQDLHEIIVENYANELCKHFKINFK